MLKNFDEETRTQKLLDVEAALAMAHAQVGNIPQKDAEVIAEKASTQYVKVERVKAIEKEIKHDIMSLVRALTEQCGESGAYVHFGATSYDIVDTANALQLKDAIGVLEKRLTDFKVILQKQAGTHKDTVMIGRTHGQTRPPNHSWFQIRRLGI
jgi:adenylosuccinate lyase